MHEFTIERLERAENFLRNNLSDGSKNLSDIMREYKERNDRESEFDIGEYITFDGMHRDSTGCGTIACAVGWMQLAKTFPMETLASYASELDSGGAGWPEFDSAMPTASGLTDDHMFPFYRPFFGLDKAAFNFIFMPNEHWIQGHAHDWSHSDIEPKDVARRIKFVCEVLLEGKKFGNPQPTKRSI
mgnify:CR=1 FL=1|tara:strand:+ start:4944 stop:5501 length:558 start_codon:yes stop_codon:yes gene_type:complete